MNLSLRNLNHHDSLLTLKLLLHLSKYIDVNSQLVIHYSTVDTVNSDTAALTTPMAEHRLVILLIKHLRHSREILS